MCDDGGLLLIVTVSHALSVVSVSVPDKYIPLVLEPDVKFMCVSCHWREDVHVSSPSPPGSSPTEEAVGR